MVQQQEHMPIHGFRSLGGQPERDAETLVLVCPFGLEPPLSRGRLYNVITLRRWREFLHSRVIHSANPRRADIQNGYARALCGELGLNARYASVSYPAAAFFAIGEDGNGAPLEILTARMPENAQVIVSYADPLGLGYTALERRLLKMDSLRGRCFILNGRGRLIPLNRENHRLLTRHRLLARYRPLDCLFGLLCLPIAASLALFDRVLQYKRG